MDILQPKLQHIDGICYRINPGNYCPDIERGAPQAYYEFDSECHGLVEVEDDEKYEIDQDQNGRYITRFHAPRLFFSFIIGSKGETKKRLEKETRTVITIPKLGCSGAIVITGKEKRNVSSARNRVNMLIMSARKKQKPTHFLSIPLNHDIFKTRFNQFKSEVCSSIPHIKEDLFQFPECLHLTLGVLKLCDDIERDLAVDALYYCHKNIISNLLGNRRELKVRIQGLEYMNDDPSAVDVLYAKVVSLGDTSLLQNISNSVSDYFIQQGLMESERNETGVLIHATLMNSKFCRKDDTESQEKKVFDATEIMKVYKDYNFGEVSISRLELSAMHTFTKTGYWQARASIDLFKY